MADAETRCVITLDVDWAPDFVIDAVAARLVDAAVPATWFVTHASPAVARLRDHRALFELGVHPNLLPRSSHGTEATAILAHVMALVPDATSLRTHALYQSSPFIAQVLASTPIVRDASLFLPRYGAVEGFRHRVGEGELVRYPYVWEDDYEMLQDDPIWDLPSFVAPRAGVTIVDFHPIHVYLNGARMDVYEHAKRLVPRLADAIPAQLDPLVVHGADGPGSAFSALVAALRGSPRACRLEDLR